MDQLSNSHKEGLTMTDLQKAYIRDLRANKKSYEKIHLETLISIDKIREFCKEEGLNKNVTIKNN